MNMNYQQEKQAYDEQVKRLGKIEALDEGPDKGTPAKVEAIHSLGFDDGLRTYSTSECLAVGPFDVNFDKRITINGQLGDYKVYLLDKDLDPHQTMTIVQRGTTARIIKKFGVILTVNYNCTPETVRNLAGVLAVLLVNDNKTVDKALVDLLNPEKDDRRSDF